jgi:hypothetical protein
VHPFLSKLNALNESINRLNIEREQDGESQERTGTQDTNRRVRNDFAIECFMIEVEVDEEREREREREGEKLYTIDCRLIL